MNKKIISEVLGWYGTVAIILAYALLSFGFISSNTLAYQLLNGSGALGIVYISISKKAAQPAVLNIIWAVIATISIAKIFFK